MSALARRIKRNRERDERPTGYQLRKAYTRIDVRSLAAAVGPLRAQLMLAASERKFFARKPTAKTRNRRRVATTPNRSRPVFTQP